MATDFRKRKKTDRLNYLFIAAAAVAVLSICVVLVVANINIYQKKQRLNARIEALKTQIANLQAENDKLQEVIGNANNDAYIEKVAREDLGLQKPGEKVVSFVKAQPEGRPNEEHKNVWSAWLGWFAGWIR